MPPPTTAADTIAGNESLLVEILLRLPARRLLRLALVCKYWHHLISSPLFIHRHSLHRHRNHSPISGIFLYRWSSSYFRFFSLDDDTGDACPSDLLNDRCFRFIQSCNGLLLCSESSDACKFFVLNPTTERSAWILPPPSDSEYFDPVRNICIAYDPAHSSQYTIVSVSESVSRIHRYAIRIYDPRSRNWRFAGVEFAAPLDLTFSGGVYWNRNIHWIGPRGSGLRFDLDRETILPMPAVPSGIGGSRKWRLFEEAGGGLYLVEIYGGAWGSELVVVMEMGREYGEWRVKYRVDLGEMITTSFEGVVMRRDDACGGVYRAWRVMCVWRNRDDLRLVVRVWGKMVWCCLRDEKLIKIGGFGKGCDRDVSEFDCVDVFPYVDSLACP